MAHVEELRQIHADINAMESIIKQSEDSRRNAQVSLKYEIVNESNLCWLGQSEETIVFGVSDYTILHQLLAEKTDVEYCAGNRKSVWQALEEQPALTMIDNPEKMLCQHSH